MRGRGSAAKPRPLCRPSWNRRTAGSDRGPKNCRHDSGSDRQNSRRDSGRSSSDRDLHHCPPNSCPNDETSSVDDIVAIYSDRSLSDSSPDSRRNCRARNRLHESGDCRKNCPARCGRNYLPDSEHDDPTDDLVGHPPGGGCRSRCKWLRLLISLFLSWQTQKKSMIRICLIAV
jgi:hypothetical protein